MEHVYRCNCEFYDIFLYVIVLPCHFMGCAAPNGGELILYTSKWYFLFDSISNGAHRIDASVFDLSLEHIKYYIVTTAIIKINIKPSEKGHPTRALCIRHNTEAYRMKSTREEHSFYSIQTTMSGRRYKCASSPLNSLLKTYFWT